MIGTSGGVLVEMSGPQCHKEAGRGAAGKNVSPAGCLQDSTGGAEKGIPQTGETHGLGVKVHRKGENARCRMG